MHTSYHICLLNIWKVINSPGGSEKVFCEMANALATKGYKVTAICCDAEKGAPFFELDSRVRFINAFNGVPLLSRGIIKNLRSLNIDKFKRKENRRIIDCQWKAKSIQSVLSNIDPIDLFICTQSESTYILKNILKCDTPVITMCHNNPEVFIKNPQFSFCNEAINSCEALQVLMPEYVDEARSVLDKVPIIYIPNSAPQIQESASLHEKRIINVSRFDEQKRIDLLVEAFALIASDFPDWTVHHWGSYSPQTKQIMDLIQGKKLQNQFFLNGSTTRISEEFRRSSIFAIPSAYEGFCLALAEAMATGLPPVGCTDCSSVNSLIRNKSNGLLVEPTPEKYAEALAKLMSDFDLRKKLGTQSKVDMEAFAPDKIWDQWDKLIKNILRN